MKLLFIAFVFNERPIFKFIGWQHVSLSTQQHATSPVLELNVITMNTQNSTNILFLKL